MILRIINSPNEYLSLIRLTKNFKCYAKGWESLKDYDSRAQISAHAFADIQ